MGPKKKLKEKKTRVEAIGKKPSPKKMSPLNKQSPPPSVLRSNVNTAHGKADESPPDTNIRLTPSENMLPSTPASERATPLSPRSNERYDLRNITPPSYSLVNPRYSGKTPLRTPSGIMKRNPSRAIGRTPLRTPFRTPRIKSLGREPQPNRLKAFKTHKEEAAIWKEHLRAITSKKYKLCNLSTMSNFKYKNKRLRRKYESHLKNKVLDAFPSPLLSVSLSLSSCLTLKPNAVDALRIEISSLLMGEKESEDRMVTVYNAWLFHTSTVQSLPLGNMEWFPVMLYQGKEVVHYAVIDWLQGSFGCYISRFGIKQSDLLWIAGVWSGRKCKLKSHAAESRFELTYLLNLPEGLAVYPGQKSRGQSKVKFNIALRDVHHIWDNIVDTSRQKMVDEELVEFFSTMSNLVRKVTCIPSYLLSLHQLQTPCIKLTSDGMVRIPCADSVGVMVSHLIDIFVQTSFSYNDETSVLQDESREGQGNGKI